MYSSFCFELWFGYSNYSEDPNLQKEFSPTNRTLGFDHIYVIHLDYRTDRFERLKEISSYLGLDFDYFPAVSKYDEEFLRRFGTANMDLSQKACFLSHYLVYKEIIDKGYNSALILEDDVDFELNITVIMNDILHDLPSSWETLYVGSCQELVGERVGKNSSLHKLYMSVYPICTHAYAVSYSGVRKIVELIDPVTPCSTIDQCLKIEITDGRLSSYTVHPHPIVQWKADDNPTDIPISWETLHSLYNSTLRFLGYNGTN
ncbi:23038_t:CDS:1, partial [Cetraspora pellucida]